MVFRNIIPAFFAAILASSPALAVNINQLPVMGSHPVASDLMMVWDQSATTGSKTSQLAFEDINIKAVNYTVCAATPTSNVVCNYTADGTDDEVEINAALDALPDNGGIVTLMDGLYTLGNSIQVPSNATLHITSGATVTGEAGYSPTCVTINSRNVCSLIRNKDTTNGDDHIKVVVDGDVNLEGITVTYTNCWGGIHLHKTENSLITGSGYIHHIAYGVSTEGGGNSSRYSAVLLTESNYNVIENIEAGYTGDDVINLRRSSSYNTAQNIDAHHSKFGHPFQVTTSFIFGTAGSDGRGNKFLNNVGHDGVNTTQLEACITAHDAPETLISGNYCYNTGVGIIVIEESFDTIVEGNTIVNPYVYGIRVWSQDSLATHGVLIANNRIIGGDRTQDLGSYGIALLPGANSSDIHDISIVGNQISDFERGIVMETAYAGSDISRVSINGNHVEGSATAAFTAWTQVTGATISNISLVGNTATNSTRGFIASNNPSGDQGSINDFYIADFLIQSGVAASDGITVDGNYFTVVGGKISVLDTAIQETTGADNNRYQYIDTSDSVIPYALVGADSSWVGFSQTGGVSLDAGTGYGNLKLDGSSGGCLMLRDTDDAGWTKCKVLDGVMSCATDADGVCD